MTKLLTLENLETLKRYLFWGLIAATVTLSVGCATRNVKVADHIDSRNAEAITTVKVAGDVGNPGDASTASAFTVGLREWWTEFDDPALDQLVAAGLSGNFSIRQAFNSLSAAEAVVRRERAGWFPSVTGQGQARFQDADDGSSREWTKSTLVAGAADYELDLWGRLGSTVEAARFDRQAQAMALKSAAVTLSAEISRSWYQLLAARSQKTLLEEQIATNETLYQIILGRFKRGLVRATDVLRQKRLLESTSEQLIVQNTELALLQNQIAALLGMTPAELEELPAWREARAVTALPVLVPLTEGTVTANLVNQRPDVGAAFYDVMGADRRVASAIASQYPRITLGLSSSTRGGDPADLFQNWTHALVAGLAGPIFDAGQRAAEVRRTEAQLMNAINGFRNETIEAIREVEDALVQEKMQRERYENIMRQAELAGRTVDQLRNQYLNGTVDYLDVLQGLQTQQQIDRDVVAARARILEFRIALHRAVGGGLGEVVVGDEDADI